MNAFISMLLSYLTKPKKIKTKEQDYVAFLSLKQNNVYETDLHF